jgi:poly-gamma-glutamate capsule biosynthesis protein CapA/YwtB (metallophosphatase superfamily)
LNRLDFRCCIILLFFLMQNILSAQDADTITGIYLLAIGDVNLGRMVGQELLKGDTDYPFIKFGNVLKHGDEVFANLECPVTEQNGETQSPKSNVVFCAPPGASKALRRSGITVVSTANNHAFDYGVKGVRETIKYLVGDGILYAGTVSDSGNQFSPVIIERDGIKIGFLAYTQTVNILRGIRSGLISMFDSARVQSEILSLRPMVDFILVSYHGGEEYRDSPGSPAEKQIKYIAECGADIVIGHHPHVPNGITIQRNCLIFYSLGNAVFNQPQRFWTQRSYAAVLFLTKRNGNKSISSIELIPFRPGFQPSGELASGEADRIIRRIQKLSTVSIIKTERGYFVKTQAQ